MQVCSAASGGTKGASDAAASCMNLKLHMTGLATFERKSGSRQGPDAMLSMAGGTSTQPGIAFLFGGKGMRPLIGLDFRGHVSDILNGAPMLRAIMNLTTTFVHR